MEDLAFIEAVMEEIKGDMLKLHRKIWELAEPSNVEYQSAKLIAGVLRENGFAVTEGVCGRPTAFVATFGSGHPSIGFLGEYDALPGLSQECGLPERKEHVPGGAGHGCGHSNLGVGSLSAALIIKRYLEAKRIPGTITYFGCCAEEDHGVKPLMARDGMFDEIDCVFAWHPQPHNTVHNTAFVAIRDLIVEFKGQSSHAGSAPQLGRSALEACELMNVSCNYLKGHLPDEARIMYAYQDAGGKAANIIPDHAVLKYGIRAREASVVEEVSQRVIDCAKGAALMTGTEVTVKPRTAYCNQFQNTVVAYILSEAAQEVGAPQWSEEDFALAREFVEQFPDKAKENLKKDIQRTISDRPLEEVLQRPLDTDMEAFDHNKVIKIFGASDVGDVGFVTPTASVTIATVALGTPMHSWFWAGMTGSSIGEKGLICAAKILALAATKVYNDPHRLDGAQEERIRRTGGVYHCGMVD
ncbi:MAG: amidohydrolase [Oscillospiraceae bacterium]